MSLLRFLFPNFPRPSAPTYSEFYDADYRRQNSPEVAYGLGWRHQSDPGASYALFWIEDTHEVCVARNPPPDLALAGDPLFGPDIGGYLALSRSHVIYVLGQATARTVLDSALDGWQSHVEDPGSLQWALERLEEAAGEVPGNRQWQFGR